MPVDNAAAQGGPLNKVTTFFRRLHVKPQPAAAGAPPPPDPRTALRSMGEQAAAKDKQAVASGKADIESRQLLKDARIALERLALAAPFGAAAIVRIDTAVTAAETQIGAGAFAAAADLLRKEKVDDAVRQGQAQWEAARKGLGTGAPAAATRLADLRTDLASRTNELNRKDAAALGGRLDKIERELVTAANMPGQAERVAAIAGQTQALETVRADFDTQLDRFQTDAAAARTGIKTLRDQLEELAPLNGRRLPLIPASDAASLRKLLDSAAFAVDDRDLLTARMLLDRADERRAQLDGAIATARQDRADWTGTWADALDDLKARLDTISGTAKSPHVTGQVAALQTSMQALKPGEDVTFGNAIAQVRQAQQAITELQAADQAWSALHPDHGLDQGAPPPAVPNAGADPAEAFRQPAADLIAQIEQQFGGLHDTVKAKTRNKHTTIADGELATRFTKAQAEWKAKLGAYHDAASLAGQDTINTLQAIKQDLAALHGPKIDEAIELGKLALAQQAYLVTKGVVTGVVERHLAIDAAKGGAALMQIDAIAATLEGEASSRDYRKAAAELNAIATDAREDMLAKQLAVKRAQDGVEAALAPLRDKLGALSKAASKASGSQRKALDAAVETLRGEYEQMRAMGALSNLAVLEALPDDLNQLDGRIDEMIKAASGEKVAGPGMLTFNEVRKMVGEARTALGKADVKTYATVAAFDLGDKLTDLENAVGTESMAALGFRVAGLTAKLAAVKQEAASRKTFVEGLNKDPIAAIRKALKGKALTHAAAYRDSVAATIEAKLHAAQFAAEGEYNTIRTSLREVLAELRDLGAGGDAAAQALLTKEGQAQDVKRQQAADSGRWDAKKKAVDKQMAALKAPKPAKAPLTLTLGSIAAQVKARGDYQDGIEQLDVLLQRIALVAANPEGLTISARNHLPEVAERLRRAVDGFSKGLDGLRAEIDGSALDEPGKQQVAIQVNALRFLFVPAVAVGVQAAAAKESTPKARDAAREKALREVRAMQACLKTDDRLQLLPKTKLMPTAAGLLSELGLALLDLENNLLASK